MSTAAGMAFPFAEGVLALFRAYAIVGVLVAFSFLLFGLDRIDAAARQSYVFRALIFPGLVLIWPVVVLRWRQASAGAAQLPQAPVARHAAVHAVVWVCLAALIPLLLGAAFLQGRPAFPERLSTPLSAEGRP